MGGRAGREGAGGGLAVWLWQGPGLCAWASPATARGRQRLPPRCPLGPAPGGSPCFSEVGHVIPSLTPPLPNPWSLSTVHRASLVPPGAQDGEQRWGEGFAGCGGGRAAGSGETTGRWGGARRWPQALEGGASKGAFQKRVRPQAQARWRDRAGWRPRSLLLRKRRPGRGCDQDLPS